MEEIDSWKGWTMKKILTTSTTGGVISPMMDSAQKKLHAKSQFHELVLGTESEIGVGDSILDRLSFGGTFTINDLELKEADFFAASSAADSTFPVADSASPSPSQCDNASSHENQTLAFGDHENHTIVFGDCQLSDVITDASQTAYADASHKPLPPFHHFRLPPPPPPRDIALRSVHHDHVADVAPDLAPDVDDMQSNVPLNHNDVITTETRPPEAKARWQLTGCSSAPSTISPFRAKGKNSKLFSNERRRATADGSAAPG